MYTPSSTLDLINASSFNSKTDDESLELTFDKYELSTHSADEALVLIRASVKSEAVEEKPRKSPWDDIQKLSIYGRDETCAILNQAYDPRNFAGAALFIKASKEKKSQMAAIAEPPKKSTSPFAGIKLRQQG